MNTKKHIITGPSTASPTALTIMGIFFFLPGLIFLLIAIFGPADDFKTRIIGIGISSIFVAVGGGMIAVSKRTRKVQTILKERQKQFPSEPWRWQGAWDEGVMENDADHKASALWAFATMWNLVSLPLYWFLWNETDGITPATFFGVLFPAIGIFAFVLAVRTTINKRRFGNAHLEFKTLPGVIGGKFRGRIFTEEPLPANSDFAAALRCVRRERVQGHENSTTIADTILWQERIPIDESMVEQNSEGSTFAVEFQIPYSAKPSDFLSKKKHIQWQLIVSSATVGLSWERKFTVPVFKTEDSDESIGERAVDYNELDLAFQQGVIGTSKVEVAGWENGTLELYFPPCRLIAQVIASWAATAILAGAACFVHYSLEDNKVFFWGPSVIAMFLLYVAIRVTFGSRRILASVDGLTLSRSLLGMRSERKIEASEITKIEHTQTFQNQDTPTFRVIAHLKGYKEVKCASDILDKEDARVIAAFLNTAMGRCA